MCTDRRKEQSDGAEEMNMRQRWNKSSKEQSKRALDPDQTA